MALTNFLKDIGLLWPYLWPFKSILIQLQVVICLAILLGGRVVNLYIPILSKYIGLLLHPLANSF